MRTIGYSSYHTRPMGKIATKINLMANHGNKSFHNKSH